MSDPTDHTLPSRPSNPGRRRALQGAVVQALVPALPGIGALLPLTATAQTLSGGSYTMSPDPRRTDERPVDGGSTMRSLSIESSTSTDAPPNSNPLDAIGEYRAVSPGSWMGFCVSDNGAAPSQTRRCTYVIERVVPNGQTLSRGTINAGRQATPTDRPWMGGSNWSQSLGFFIPLLWGTGIYRATFTSADGNTAIVNFVVRALFPGMTSSIAIEVPFDTLQAYNNWGGKSLYDFNSTDGRASSVSTRRPLGPGCVNDIETYVIPFAQFCEKAGIPVEFISGGDLKVNPWLLSSYRLCVIVGHDEYWSTEMRATLEQFIGRGGNLAIFGANTLWWRTELGSDANGHGTGVLTCTKTPGTTTDLWDTYRASSAVIGDAFMAGGFIGAAGQDGMNGAYAVYQPTHWAFANTGLARGARFGDMYQTMRYEVDGVDYSLDASGTPVPTGKFGTPAGLTILAMAVLPDGWTVNGPNPNAALSTFRAASGATVVNVGTTDWFRALVPYVKSGTWTVECQITKNVLQRLR